MNPNGGELIKNNRNGAEIAGKRYYYYNYYCHMM